MPYSFLHQETISARYTYQYFVSCEGKFTMDQLLWAIADVLHIPSDWRQLFGEYYTSGISEGLYNPMP